jgi:hypothetical protein
MWFQIDFEIHPQFANISPDIVAKHGHHIRVVKNALTIEQVSVLENVHVDRLRYLHIEAATSIFQQERTYKIVTRNISSLQKLVLFAARNSYKTLDYSSLYVSAAAFAPQYWQDRISIPKDLTSLKIKGLILRYSSFESILRVCTNLIELRLPHVALEREAKQPFQHTGITLFSFGLNGIFYKYPERPSILLHFPNLTTLHTWNDHSKDLILSDRIKEEMSRVCPHLTQFKLEDYSSGIITQFLTSIATNVTRITFEEEIMSPETVSAIVLHQATLKKVAHFYAPNFDYDKDEVPRVSDRIKVSDEMLQLIPRSCARLERLNLHPYEMDMDAIESKEWACKGLRKLRIRVRGLDTKEQTLRTIAFWRAGCWRRWQKKAVWFNAMAVEDEQLEADQSIEARVARHLLKFEQLQCVWLGYQTWTSV